MTNIELISARRPARASFFGRSVTIARWLWDRVQEKRRLRATIRALDRLSDASLRDIGLERGEIHQVYRSRHYVP